MPLDAYSAPEPSNLSKQSVDQLASSVATQLGYSPGDPLEPIVARLGGRLHLQDFWELKESVSGSIKIQNEGDFDIYIASYTGPARDRFTIAHEIGHYVLHYLYQLKNGKDPGPTKAQRYESGRVEWEANWFAAGFLMPADKFAMEFAKLEGDIDQLAEVFKVSTAAAQIRVNALSLD